MQTLRRILRRTTTAGNHARAASRCPRKERLHNCHSHCTGHHCRCHRTLIGLNVALIVISVIGYGVNQLILKRISSNWFVHGYLNDVLAMLLLLPFSDLLLGRTSLRCHGVWRSVTLMVIAFGAGVFWEFVTPLYLRSSVSDSFDFLAYLAGSTIYIVGRSGVAK